MRRWMCLVKDSLTIIDSKNGCFMSNKVGWKIKINIFDKGSIITAQ
jgi:hypothetical protein